MMNDYFVLNGGRGRPVTRGGADERVRTTSGGVPAAGAAGVRRPGGAVPAARACGRPPAAVPAAPHAVRLARLHPERLGVVLPGDARPARPADRGGTGGLPVADG